MAFTKKLSGGTIGSTPIVRSCLAIRDAAELFHKAPRKRVSKQATAWP